MSKYFGEMTKEELIQAIKEILRYKKPAPIKKSLIEEVVEFFNNLKLISQNIKKFFETPCTKDVFISRGIKVKLFIQEVIETIVFVIVALIVLKMFIGEIRWIPSGSMKPTLIEGDKVFISKMEMFKSKPKQGDIMVFYPPFETLEKTPIKIFKRLTGLFCEDIAYIKRVIALPGQKFEIREEENGMHQVYINDEPLHEPYVKNPLDYTHCDETMLCGPTIIPENHYMMLGDNRGNSKDSRYWGPLPEDKFIGKAVHIFRFSSLKYNKIPNQYE